jgi:hypothetical protein
LRHATTGNVAAVTLSKATSYGKAIASLEYRQCELTEA